MRARRDCDELSAFAVAFVPARKAAQPAYYDGAWMEPAIYERAALPPGAPYKRPYSKTSF
jgi:hypothetical protein